MNAVRPLQPLADLDAGEHDGFLAAALVVAGAAIAIAILTHHWPAWLSPPAHTGSDHDANLRLLKGMLLLEGAGLVALGIGVARAGEWLRQLGGELALDARAPIALALLVASHGIACLCFLPPQQLMSPEPVHTGAHLAHFYRIFAAHRILSDGGRAWGYDPFFLAGYPAGWLFDPDTRGDALFAHAAAFLGLAYATKAYIVLVHAAVPLVLYVTARTLGLGRGEALLAAGLGVLDWLWGRPTLGGLRWVGMHSFLFACELVCLGLACAVRFLDPDHRVRFACLVGWTAIAALVGYVHPAGLLLLAPGSVLAFAFGFRALRRRDRLALGLAIACLAVVHATWIAPLARFHLLWGSEETAGQLRGPFDLVRIFARPSSTLAVVILGLGVAGLWMRRRTAPRFVWIAATTTVAWLVAAGCGTWLGPLARVECPRALVPAVLWMALPAGIALHGLLARMRAHVGALATLVALLIAGTLPPFCGLLDARFFYVHRLHATLDGGVGDLLVGIDAAAPAEGRILFEATANARTPVSDGEPIEALIPIHTRRPVLGAPQPGMPFASPALEFGAGQLGGRALADWTPDELVAFLERYDVSTIVAWSAAARAFLAAQAPQLERVGAVHDFDLYRCPRPWTAAAAGEAEVHADYDRIEISPAGAGVLVLKWHWSRGLRAFPASPVERDPVPGDDAGFIRLRPHDTARILLRPE